MFSPPAFNPDLIKLRQLVDASIRRSPGGESHIIANHMQQIEDLIVGQGIDFVPEADPAGQRAPFVRRFSEQSNLQQYIPDIIRKVMGTGEVLCWLRSSPLGYRIRYYTAHEFKPYYSPDSDDLYGAVVVSSYSEDQASGYAKARWVKMVILAEGTFVEVSDQKPKVAGIGGMEGWQMMDTLPLEGDRPSSAVGDNVQFFPNPFQFLPLVVLRNKPTGPGQRASDDFSEFAKQLVSHDMTMRAVGKNVRKYARQTIFTNLERSKVMRGGMDGSRSYGRSGVFASDFYDAGQAMQRLSLQNNEPEEEIADVIGVDGLPGENFMNVISWNPIQTDQLQYLEILEDKLHWAMGSISKRGGGTAYEVRANLSWPQATANKKALNILTHGLCRIIEMAIAHEEWIFEMTGGLMGMIPAGDRSVRWRRVELITPTPQDQLQLSILGRNLEEEGVGTREILRLLFPDKTDKEIQAMTGGAGGVPFRKMEKTVPQLVQLFQTALSLPPEMGTALLPVANLLINNLIEAIQYGRQQPGTGEPLNASTLPNDSLSALIAAASAGNGQPGDSNGMVSADNRQPAGEIPAAGTHTGNPLTAAFGRLTDWGRSPILNALRR